MAPAFYVFCLIFKESKKFANYVLIFGIGCHSIMYVLQNN